MASSTAGKVLVPLRIEARALSPELGDGVALQRTGMGPRRARAAARRAAQADADAIAVAGFCGALDPGLEPGDIVVATELREGERTIACPAAALLAGALRRAGLRVHEGPIVSTPRLVRGAARADLRATGAIAVDMESAWLAEAAARRPFAVVRAVVDTPAHELTDPVALARGAREAYRALRAAAPVLGDWCRAAGPRAVVLASPRASCAGVERAVEIVEQALEHHGPGVHVRKQIVHNAHVVADLERRGAVFVDEVDEVPEGATLVFSAHGVSPAVRGAADERELHVIDATCPLVNKVHAEAKRFARDGYTIVLVGHEGHEEVEGTFGEAPQHVRVVADVGEVETLEVDDPDRVAYLTQTTLAVDETDEVVAALRARFPRLRGPNSSDICYATQNRQDAVKELAAASDVVLVVGSANSSNSRRLVEVAQRHGATAYLIDDERAIDLAWLAGARTVGLTAGASAPEALVQRVLRALRTLGETEVVERPTTRETVRFKLPATIATRKD
ncbi:MAG TPA: 4-hydroxy-3-methylbut-2-enyl diphosphate reductase [Solirubrobacteraceae bacterium]|nr:4-hydroxy-3-methylbut-2-enyl diphosphate reductase [Solirubrobacteraceae bacterium]